MRFKKLEELRQRGWVEEQPEVKKKVVRPTLNVKKAAKPAGGPSRLRDMIAGEHQMHYEFYCCQKIWQLLRYTYLKFMLLYCHLYHKVGTDITRHAPRTPRNAHVSM